MCLIIMKKVLFFHNVKNIHITDPENGFNLFLLNITYFYFLSFWVEM